MSCLDKCLVTQRGGMQGHYKYTDGFSDTSSVGSFMDDTDREVCSLTDRAFKSLCIGDEAIYNDTEYASSPVERYDAFPLDSEYTDILKFSNQQVPSLGRKQNGGAVTGAGEATVGATFQQSVLDMARKGLKNGAIETAWKQSRSKMMSSGGGNVDNHEKGQARALKDFTYKNSCSDMWENAAMWNIRGEPFDYAGNFKPINNHSHTSGDATAQTSNYNPEEIAGKSSKGKHGKSITLKKLSHTNFFLHSEHSPFESWQDSNRIVLEQNRTPDLVSTNQRPMWYDSPVYKELRAEHGLQIALSKEHELNQTKSVDTKVSPVLPPTSTCPAFTPQAAPISSVVLQNARTTEKRSESETNVSLPPWKRNMGQTMAAVPWSRPSIAFPTGERECRRETGASTEAMSSPSTSNTNLTSTTPVTMLTPNTLVTMATPVTSATMLDPTTATKSASKLTPITPVLTSTTPITSATKLTPKTPVTMAAPITPVTMAAPITPVTMVATITPATMAATITPVRMAAHITPITMAAPITPVTMATPITTTPIHTPITPFTTATPVTFVNPAIAVTAVNEPPSSASTPFNISQLLTPIINTRQGTGTSEVLQSAFTPSSLDLNMSRSSSETSSKSTIEVKSRNSYKAIASGLLFNVKDNRKRVKSTYSPTKFKTTELSKQPSKPETDEPKNALAISEATVAEANVSHQPEASNVRPASEVVQESTDAQIVNHRKPADGGVSDDYLTLSSPHAVKEAAAFRNLNSTQENTQGEIQHAEGSQYGVLEQSNFERALPGDPQGMNLPTRNLHKAESVTGNTMPAADKTINSTVNNNRDSRIKETQPARQRLFFRSVEDKLNDIELSPGDTYRDGELCHNDRTDMYAKKQKDKSPIKPGLSVKEKVELFSNEINHPKSLFVAHKRDRAKLEPFAKLDKPSTEEEKCACKERENIKQNLIPEQEEQQDGKEGRTNHAFSARQNQYIKNERNAIKDDMESDQADEDKDATARRYNRHISMSDILENTEHQNLEPGDFSQRGVAGVDNEFARNDIFANDKNSTAQQEVLKKGGSRHLRSKDVLLGKEEGSDRVLHKTRANLHRAKSRSAECLHHMKDTFFIKKRPAETEAFTVTENQVEEKEVKEDVCVNNERKSSPKSSEERLFFIGEKDGVKLPSNAGINNYLTAHDRIASEDKDQKEHWNGMKKSNPAEDNVFAKTDWAATEQEVPMKEHSRSDTLEEQDRARSKVKDIEFTEKVEKMQEEEHREQTNAGANETRQNEHKKSTSIKEKMDLKGIEKSDSGYKERDGKIKQILKLKDKVKDIFSIKTNKTQEEMAKQDATQKNQQQTQSSPCSDIETNKMKQQGHELSLEERMEPEQDSSSGIQEIRETVTEDSSKEANREQNDNISHKQQPVTPVPLTPHIAREGQPSFSDLPAEFYAGSMNDKTEVDKNEVHPAIDAAEEIMEETAEIENTIVPETKDTSEISPLQYYAIDDGESEIEMRLFASPDSTLYTEASTTSSNDLDEGGWVRCLIDSAKLQTPGLRSNSSSPFPTRHTLFKVKDNTVRTSPLTKIIKSPLQRVPEEFRLGSPRDSWSGSEKGEDERGRAREWSRVLSPHETLVSRRGSSLRGTPVKSFASQPKISPVVQEHRSRQCSPQTEVLKQPPTEREEGRMDASVSSGRMESITTNAEDRVGENITTSPHIEEETEDTKETTEKSESATEVQPLGKPPPVLPKSEKALRRAKRLTNKRIKKAEAENKREGKSESSRNPAREKHTEPPPPSPAETAPLHSAQNPPQAPQPHPKPAHRRAVPATLAQSFPVTQRKLLQDPDSGQYFMVDMPVQVKTKMFFDPETGKYIQLPVQAPEVTVPRPPSMDMLSSPYLLYPGFVPVPISSLPPRGSASQTPASETLMGDRSRNVPCRQEDYQHLQLKEANPYVEPTFVPYESFPEETLYMEHEGGTDSRIMNSVPTSELDSFAVGNL